jgi:hypothetical protein
MNGAKRLKEATGENLMKKPGVNLIMLFTVLSLATCGGVGDNNGGGGDNNARPVSVVTTASNIAAKVLLPADVAGHTKTPEYYSYSSTKIRFLDYSLASSTANIVDNGNDPGAIEDFPTYDKATNGFAEAKFYPGLENNLIDSINGGLDLSAKKYSAIVLERNFSGFWMVDSDNSGMTDYASTGWYASRDGFKDQRLRTTTYWLDGGREYQLETFNYIVLVDEAILSKYFIFNPSDTDPGAGFLIGDALFNADGSMKNTDYGYDRLSQAERDFVTYVIVSTANTWGADANNPPLNFKNQWMDPTTPQPFSSYIFIPTDPVDLTDLPNHTSATIQISWDLQDVLFVEGTLGSGSGDAFLGLIDPWTDTSMGSTTQPSEGTGNALLKCYVWNGKGVKPYLYERDPVGGPMNWQVSVQYR